jgi:transmembrane sensor
MNSGTDENQTTPATVAEQAGAWDARLRAPDCTDEDRARFAEWRDADPAHQQTFERLQAIVATLRHERSRADISALRDEALRAGQRRRRRVWFTTAAAAAIAALTLGVAVWNGPSPAWLREPIAAMVTRLSGAQIYSTSTGQRSTFVLDDGSSIELNARSRIEVRFSDYRREVALVEGQALFNVTKDLRRPFIVRAGDRQVLAIGTRFDVRLDATSVQVTLLEGKVRIEEDTAMWKRGQEIELTPGKQWVARLNAPSLLAERRTVEGSAEVVRDIDVAKVTAWREGRIYFDDLPLQEAIDEMNRHSTVHIRLDSAELARLRVNGMFKAGEQEIFVSALQEYFQIEAQRQGAREIVLTKR